MCIFQLINLIKMTNLTIIQIEHLVTLLSGLINKTTQFGQIRQCPTK